jgi:hypothetical protein
VGWMDEVKKGRGRATIQWKEVVPGVWSWESPMQRRSGEGITAVVEVTDLWEVSIELPNGQVYTEKLTHRYLGDKATKAYPLKAQETALNMATETILQVLVEAVGG